MQASSPSTAAQVVQSCEYMSMSTYTQLKSIPYYRIMLTNVNDLQGLNYGKVN